MASQQADRARRIPWGNDAVAAKLREAADLLTAQNANPFRAAAYRRAADTVAGLETEVRDIVEREGPAGLDRLPHIGRGIAAAIVELVATGRWTRLERLRGEVEPVELLQTVPGLGPKLAETLAEDLHVDTLEGLEAALYDGRVEALPGFGPRRVAALKASLAAMLGRVRSHRDVASPSVPVATLLDVDAEYRRRAAAGELPRIAPRRFNPEGRAWLPVLHTVRGPWHFTALYSNTARAHELGRTDDWVVLYWYDGAEREQQCTVVTERRGPYAGQRVVRGRERECAEHHRAGRGS